MKNYSVSITYQEDIRAKSGEEAKEIAWGRFNTYDRVEVIVDEYVKEYENDG